MIDRMTFFLITTALLIGVFIFVGCDDVKYLRFICTVTVVEVLWQGMLKEKRI